MWSSSIHFLYMSIFFKIMLPITHPMAHCCKKKVGIIVLLYINIVCGETFVIHQATQKTPEIGDFNSISEPSQVVKVDFLRENANKSNQTRKRKCVYIYIYTQRERERAHLDHMIHHIKQPLSLIDDKKQLKWINDSSCIMVFSALFQLTFI